MRRMITWASLVAALLGAGVAQPAVAGPVPAVVAQAAPEVARPEAGPQPAHPVPYCRNYLQGALSDGGAYWYSPQMTSPAGSVCGNVHVQHVTNHNWAPPPYYFYARIRVYPGCLTCNSYVGQWILFQDNCYECSKIITSGAWGGLRYRVEFQKAPNNVFTAGVYFNGAD